MPRPPADNSSPRWFHQALARNTGFLVSHVGVLASRHFAERIATVGLVPREWGALNVLDRQDFVTQHALCQSVGMDPSTMVSTIDDLEAKGLVERRRNPQDRRAHAVHITDKGRRTLAEARKLARGAQEELLAPLSKQEREQLHALLLRMATAHAGQTAVANASERAEVGRKRPRAE
jgi:MarR family transcriptional regulator, lower aerobic nicotinate degradation pathway regulator